MKISLQPGEPFNPYRMFTGLFIPEGLARCTWIGAGARLTFGRLARYAGEDGRCYPTTKTLGAEIGVSERQAQRYVAELERAKPIRRVERFAARAQTSNAFEFLWHELFERRVTDLSGGGVTDTSPEGATDTSPKESQTEESHSEEKNRLRLSRRESQKAQFAPGVQGACCRQYPEIREALADYMQERPSDERLYPSDREIVDIIEAAKPASEQEVIECLRYLSEERGLRPGTRNGPRHFAWFRTVVADHFLQKRDHNMPPAAAAHRECEGNFSEQRFDSMTEAF